MEASTAAPRPQSCLRMMARPFNLAVPVAIGNLFMLAPGVCDTYVAGALGATVQAAVGVGATIATLVIVFVTGGLRALVPEVARRNAAGKQAECGAVLAHAVLLSGLACVGAVVLAAVVLVPTQLGSHAGDRGFGATLAAYLTIRLAGLPVFALFVCGNKFQIGIQRTWPIAVIAPLASLLNVGLALGLGLGRFGLPDWGAPGIAVAYLLAWSAGLVLQFGWLLAGPRWHQYQTRLRPAPLDRAMVRSLAGAAVPLGLAALFGSSSYLVPTFLLAATGPRAVAAYFVVSQVYRIPERLLDLVGSSSCSVVASHVGRGESDGARRQHRWSLVGALVVFGIMALAIVAARGPIVGLLAADDATAALARAAMLPAAAALVALVVETICLNTLIAAGDVRAASAIETGSGWILFVPACLVVVGMANGGPVAVWVVEAVTGALTAGILALRIHRCLGGTARGATPGLAPQRP
jgi:MATE family multidrug resistance protein